MSAANHSVQVNSNNCISSNSNKKQNGTLGTTIAGVVSGGVGSNTTNPGSATPVQVSNGNNMAPQQVPQPSQSTSPPTNNAPKYGTLVPNRVFVGGISANTTEGELAQLFSAYGTVKATKIITDRAGVSKGYGFVTFESEEEAKRLQRESDNIMLRERRLNIAPAIKKQPFNRSFDVPSPPPNAQFYYALFYYAASAAAAAAAGGGVPYAAAYQNGMAYYATPPQSQASAADPNAAGAQQPVYQAPPVYAAPSAAPPTAPYPMPMYPPQPLFIHQQYPYQPVPLSGSTSSPTSNTITRIMNISNHRASNESTVSSSAVPAVAATAAAAAAAASSSSSSLSSMSMSQSPIAPKASPASSPARKRTRLDELPPGCENLSGARASLIEHKWARTKCLDESSLLVENHEILPEVYDIKRWQSDIQTSPWSMIFGNRNYVFIEILHIESPSLFYVTVPQWSDERNKLSKNLRRHYSEISPPDKQWTVDEICVGYSEKDKLYYRGIIDKVLDNNCYEIFFKDFAQTEILSTKNLYEFDPKFSDKDYSIKCRLSGVKPAGDQGKWSKTGIEYFTELVSKYPQLYITKEDVITDKTLAVDLIAIFEEDAGPLKPTKIETVRLNQLLLDEGLALPVKVNKGTTLGSVLDDIKLESNPKPKESGGNLTVKDMFKRKETVWLPPYNFTERKFKAWPSYVDDNACVYIHDFKARRILPNIRRMLNQYFSKSGPDPPHLWEAGQMCTVQYQLDNSYYRGLVLKPENDGIIKVRLVDYGSEEGCKHDELRSKYAMTDTPQLAVKCYLADVEPLTEDGTWPVPILDLIHLTLVDKECEIAIQNESLSESPLYIVIYKDNKNINNEIMKNWDWNKLQNIPVSDVPVEENDEVIIEGEVEVDEDDELTEENLMDTDLKYKQCNIPENQKIFNAVVINILNYKTVLIEPSFVASMLKNTSEQFNKLSEEINKHVAKLASAIDPFEGMACVALFSDDNQWYRAEVISINEERTEVQVLFNDYGNLETVPIEDIKIPRKKWLDFPLQMLKCKIWGIEKCDKTTENKASELMNEILRDKTVVCQAMETEPDIQIKLVDPETYDLVYKNLIDDNIIKIVD